MNEEKKEEFAFIREKIIEKPVNKKRLFRQGGYTAGFAVLFGVVSCFVFTALQPVMENWLHPKEDPTISIPSDEWGTEQVFKDTEQVLESEEITMEDTPEPEVQEEPSVVKELELSDYQILQNKIYAIGQEANRSIVTVTSVVSDTDWYNNSFESNGQASGIIIGDNGSELLILTEHKAVLAAQEIRVTFIDEVTVGASLKKYDGNTGLAVLAVGLGLLDENTKSRISYAALGNSLAVAQGNVAIAIGRPAWDKLLHWNREYYFGRKCHSDSGCNIYRIYNGYCRKQQQQRRAFKPGRRSSGACDAGLQRKRGRKYADCNFGFGAKKDDRNAFKRKRHSLSGTESRNGYG